MTFLAALATSKVSRLLIVGGLVSGAVVALHGAVAGLLLKVLPMPPVMVRVWNYFGVSLDVDIIISAYMFRVVNRGVMIMIKTLGWG